MASKEAMKKELERLKEKLYDEIEKSFPKKNKARGSVLVITAVAILIGNLEKELEYGK